MTPPGARVLLEPVVLSLELLALGLVVLEPLALEPPELPLPKVEPLAMPPLVLGEELLLDDEPATRARQSSFAEPVRLAQSAAVFGLLVLPAELPMLELPLPALEPLPMLELPLPMLPPDVLPVLEPDPMLLPVPLLPYELLPCAPAPCANVNPIAAAPSAAARVLSFIYLLLAVMGNASDEGPPGSIDDVRMDPGRRPF